MGRGPVRFEFLMSTSTQRSGQLAYSTLIAAVLCSCSSSGGAGPLGADGKPDPSIVAEFVPGAAGSSAPSFIRPGLRFTYQVDSATLPGEGSNWTPNEHGEWQDQNGNKYDRSKKEAGGSASTYQQYDVILLNDKQSMMIQDHFNISPLTSNPTNTNRIYMIGSAGFGTMLWAPPDVLSKVPDSLEVGKTVSHGKWSLGGQDVDGVMFAHRDKDAHDMYVYHAETGALIQYGISSTAAGNGMIAPDEQRNTGSTILISGILAEIRQLAVPWASDPDPDWVKTFKAIEYTGESVFQLVGDMTGGIKKSLNMKFKAASRGEGWVGLIKSSTETTEFGTSTSGESPGIMTPWRLDPLWISPVALSRLTEGQIIDSDNHTKLVTKVGKTENGPNGPMIDIYQGNMSQEAHMWFDLKTGVMTQFQSDNAATHTRMNLTLKGIE